MYSDIVVPGGVPGVDFFGVTVNVHPDLESPGRNGRILAE